jgi:hypothetical protein
MSTMSKHVAHALTIEGGRVLMETVADTRGDRPWSRRTTNTEGPPEPSDIQVRRQRLP